MKNKIALGLLVSVISLSGVSAMEMTTGGDVMTKDTMVKTGDTMMKDTMMGDKAVSPTSDAGMGARGEHVSMLQKYLVSKGFLTIPEGVALGYFGSLTKKAVMSYQESIGVVSTGYFGPKTRMMMQDKMKMMGSETMMKDKMKMMGSETMMKDKMTDDGKMMKGDTTMKDKLSQ